RSRRFLTGYEPFHLRGGSYRSVRVAIPGAWLAAATPRTGPSWSSSASVNSCRPPTRLLVADVPESLTSASCRVAGAQRALAVRCRAGDRARTEASMEVSVCAVGQPWRGCLMEIVRTVCRAGPEVPRCAFPPIELAHPQIAMPSLAAVPQLPRPVVPPPRPG